MLIHHNQQWTRKIQYLGPQTYEISLMVSFCNNFNPPPSNIFLPLTGMVFPFQQSSDVDSQLEEHRQIQGKLQAQVQHYKNVLAETVC